MNSSRQRIGYVVLWVFLSACTASRSFVDRPIIFDKERELLTLEYLENRYGLEQNTPKIDPKMIVLHWTVFPTFQESFEAFNPATLPNWRPDIKNVSGLNVSSQFLVDREGTIYQLLPETTMARHVIGLNHCAIGIENVGGTDEFPLTEAQLKSNVRLIRYLKKKYAIDYLIGHYEYTLFQNHPLWLEKDQGYRTVKTDPGVDFMNSVREKVSDLDFMKNPEGK